MYANMSMCVSKYESLKATSRETEEQLFDADMVTIATLNTHKH